MKSYYQKDENNIITGIWYEGSMGSNTGVLIKSPLQDFYPLNDGQYRYHWKEVSSGVIIERTENERNSDPVRVIIKTMQQVFGEIMKFYGPEIVKQTLMPVLTIDFKVYADMGTEDGWKLASEELAKTELADEMKNKLNEIMGVV